MITDHTALKAIKSKHIFGSLKLERMREDLQEYDFEVEYRKGSELIDADAISRIYEEPERRENLKEKNKNVLIGNDGKWYYKISENEMRIFPEVCERKEIIRKIHEEMTAHGGNKAVEYEVRKTFFWPKLKESIAEFLKRCTPCLKNHQKTLGGETFVTTTEPLEIVATDLMFIDQKTVLMTFIDYFTRRCQAYLIKSKESEEIKKTLKKFFKDVGIPRKLVTDNGKEFLAENVKIVCEKHKIEHHKIAIGKHQANGRIERLHRNIWQALRKVPEDVLDENMIEKILDETIIKLNQTYHRGIGCTPNEAWRNPENETLRMLNTKDSKYALEFKKLFKEKFEVGDKVVVQANAAEAQNKLNNRYEIIGKVIKIEENDVYQVEVNGKTSKRSHSQLKLCYEE